MTSEFPAAAPTFYVQTTAGKAKLFIGEFGSTRLTPLASVNAGSGVDVDQVVHALERAAWTGDRAPWETIKTVLPNPVVLACEQAMAGMPPPARFAIGVDARPLTVLTSTYFSAPGDYDLVSQASAACDLSILTLIDNYLDDEGLGVGCRLRLMSGDIEIQDESSDSAWPSGDREPIERRLFGPDELDEVLNDARWESHRARAHWFWRVESNPEGDSGEAVWVVEYFDEAVPDTPIFDGPNESDRFVVGSWNPWPITPKTRFVLWQAMAILSSTLELELDGWDGNEVAPNTLHLIGEFPRSVRSQPRDWWVQVLRSSERLVEALRTGQSWNPRTPAEEALIYLCCTEGSVDAARDAIDGRGTLRRQFRSLVLGPELDDNGTSDGENDAGPDFDWNEVPGALAGDEDVALLWRPDLDGIDDPCGDTNMSLGMGDYRPESWHVRFDRYRDDPNPASALY